MAQRAKNKPELKIVVSNTPEAPAVEPVPEQVEMPFAIVNGEPITQMPKDLYIPPQAMEVFLEAFEGPLDLLLYLIRRQNLNILDIPLAEITRQYMQYIEVMTELQLELAGEYMVMAATLAEIKSRMLLPRPKVDPEGKEEDPRAELVRRLQEYERFKRAAEDIDSLPRLERDVWMTSADLKDRSVVKLLPTVTLQEMLLAFKDVVVRSEMFAHHHISRERLSVRERMSDVLTRLEQASFVEFIRLFRLEEGRMGVTVTFMALLELVREGLIEIVQAAPFAPLHVRAAGASRKLHVVGGSEALADGTVVDDTTAVVVGEAVVGDVPPVGLLLPGDAGLDSITEQVLDPNFVDDFDEDEELLEGVDDVVGRAAAAAAAAASDREVGLAGGAAGADADAAALGEVALADAGAGADMAAGGEVALADAGAGADLAAGGEVALADAGAGADIAAGGDNAGFAASADAYLNVSLVELPTVGSTVEPVSVVDEWAPHMDSPALAYVPAGEGAASASLTGEAADFHETTALNEAGSVVDLTSSSVVNEPSVSTDAIAVAVESVLVAGPAEVSPATASVEQDVVFVEQTSAYEVAAAEFVETPSEPSDTVVGSATELDEAGAIVEPVSGFTHVTDVFALAPVGLAGVPDVAAPDDIAAAVEHSSPVDEASHAVFATTDVAVAEEVVEPISVLHLAPPLDQGALTIEPVSATTLSAFGEAAVSPLLQDLTGTHDLTATMEPTAAEPTAALNEISAVAELAPMDDLSPLADLAPPDVPPTVNFVALDEVASPDSAVASVSAPSDSIAEDLPTPESVIPENWSSSPTGDLGSPSYPGEPADLPATDVAPFVGNLTSVDAASPSFGEPPAVDVEYESLEEAVAAGEQPAVDEDVSLIGDMPVAGEASLVGDESVSGGPAVEVEEFAFDELPALDDAGQADQQPAAGAEAIVNKVPGTDESSSPGEESDD